MKGLEAQKSSIYRQLGPCGSIGGLRINFKVDLHIQFYHYWQPPVLHPHTANSPNLDFSGSWSGRSAFKYAPSRINSQDVS